jgi:hypothetical protein
MLLGDHHKLFARRVQSKNLGYVSTKNWRWAHFPLNNSLQFVAMKYYSHELNRWLLCRQITTKTYL